MISAKLAEVLELDYEETLEKVKSKQSIVTIQKRVEKEKTDIIIPGSDINEKAKKLLYEISSANSSIS